MDSNRERGALSIIDFLDMALIGSVIFLLGASLLLPSNAGRGSSFSESVELVFFALVDALRALSSPLHIVGLILLIGGGMMIILGPVWLLVGRPLARRGYL